MRAVDVIIKKRNNEPLTKEEIHFMIDGYVKGDIPDYQISALLMAICFNGLNNEEKANLTMEMLESGDSVDLSSIDGICVDKHSTGGVGDKTTLVFAPIVAACGLKVAKMSGRGLGFTGGTLDKLESIPGFNISVTTKDFLKQVKDIGIAVIGQTANIVPADKKFYALRDVTGTVDSIGLIASSIMSKKLASGASKILLDVKVGEGSFMKNLDDARELAKSMVEIGNSLDRTTVAVLTNMDEPLGRMVGNSLEVIEAIETLKGKGPLRFTELCYELAAQMLVMTNISKNRKDALALVEEKINSGAALNKLREMINAQGGNTKVIEDYSILPMAEHKFDILSEVTGYVYDINAEKIGLAGMVLGSGRQNKDDKVDLGVGLEIHKAVGDYVKAGEPLVTLYYNEIGKLPAIDLVNEAYVIQKKEFKKGKTILEVVS